MQRVAPVRQRQLSYFLKISYLSWETKDCYVCNYVTLRSSSEYGNFLKLAPRSLKVIDYGTIRQAIRGVPKSEPKNLLFLKKFPRKLSMQ